MQDLPASGVGATQKHDRSDRPAGRRYPAHGRDRLECL